MRILKSTILFAFLYGAICGAAFSQQVNQSPAAGPGVKVIDMTAKKYVYNPSPIHVKVGAKVELRITALDHDHGFKINVYPTDAAAKGSPGLVFASFKNCWRLPKGKVTIIDFTAEKPGTYPFKCCVFCGFGHMGMKGMLIVDP